MMLGQKRNKLYFYQCRPAPEKPGTSRPVDSEQATVTAFDIRVTLVSEETGEPLATATRQEVASAYLPRVGETVEHEGLMPHEVIHSGDRTCMLAEPLVVTAISHSVKRGVGGTVRPPMVHVRTRVEEGVTSFIVSRLERAGWAITRDANTLTRLDTWAHPDKLVLAGG
jgi:hypothetical protein